MAIISTNILLFGPSVNILLQSLKINTNLITAPTLTFQKREYDSTL